jgi:dynein heavy chain
VYIYDIKNDAWIDPELSHEIPRWFHSSINVSAIPNIPKWKYFIFGGSTGNFEEGGNRTTSKLSDDAYFLDIPDIKNMAWHTINIKD